MSFTNPQVPIENPKRHYDKFGFLVAAEQNDNRETEYPQKSRYHRRTSPEFGGRNNNREGERFSPNRRERENYNRSERNDREGRRRKRSDYSPSFNKGERPDWGNKRDDRMDFDSWENSYDPPPNFVTAPPPPSYSIEPPQPYPGPPYSQFPQSQYNNFLETARQEPGPDMGVPAPPPAPTLPQSNWAPTPSVLNTQEDKVKREAIASEMRNQRATLAKQKEEYFKKATVLKRELESLKQQRIELRGDSRRCPSPDSQRFLKENAKLQIEIQNKMKTINNVIDMLNGIIGENPTSGEILEKSKSRKPGQPRTPTQSPPTSRSSSADSDKHSSSRNKRKSRSKSRTKLSDKKFNYVFYDPEMHWCRVCNEFPATAKEYLNHLHSPGHHRNALAHLEAPWHDVVTNQNEGMPSYPGASSKRTPIKGLQFFVPSTAWYCKLCDQWIGDLHCASAHLKSLLHSQNYANFTELNPHWEMDWISDRQKNFEKVHKTGEGAADTQQKALYSPHTISFQADGFHTKKKKGSSPQLDKNTPEEKVDDKKDKKKKDKKKNKKKKRSSSESSTSSSSSNGSQEDRRKMKKPNKDAEGGNEGQAPRNPAADDRMLSQWMSLKQDTLTDQDKKILEKLKHRVKSRAGEKVEQKVDGRVVSREREAREVLTIQGGSRCPESLLYQRKDNRDDKKSKDNRSNRDRDYERELESGKRHQDFKPYPGRREKQDQNEERFDKQVAEKLRKQGTSTSDSKKMPFIGKMPLFKSLSNKPVKSEEIKPVDPQKCVEAAKKKRDEINAQIEEMKEKVRSALAAKEQPPPDPNLPAPGLALPTSLGGPLPPPVISETPASNRSAAPLSMSYPQTIHKIQKAPTIIPDLPPPVIAAKPDIKATPQSASKNESLHKDFQDALDIIFPSGNPPKKEQSQSKSNSHSPMDSDMSHLTNIPPPSMSQGYPQMMQQNYGMGSMGPNNMGPMGPNMGPMGPMGPNMGPMGPMGPMGSNNMGPMGSNNMGPMGSNMGPMGPNMGPMGPMSGPNNMGPMGPNNMGPMGPNSMVSMGPPPGMNMMGMPPSGHMGMMGWDYSGGMYPQTGLYDTMPQQPSNNAPTSKGRHEQEDLAMLGIDAEDIGASGF